MCRCWVRGGNQDPLSTWWSSRLECDRDTKRKQNKTQKRQSKCDWGAHFRGGWTFGGVMMEEAEEQLPLVAVGLFTQKPFRKNGRIPPQAFEHLFALMVAV